MWKRATVIVMAMCSGLGAQAADIAPEDLVKAVDKMTPEQAHQLKRELDNKSRQTRKYAWFSRFSVEFAAVWERFDKYGIENESFSADKPDLEKSMGGVLALQWKPLDYLGLGVEFGFYAGSDKDLSNGIIPRPSCSDPIPRRASGWNSWSSGMCRLGWMRPSAPVA